LADLHKEDAMRHLRHTVLAAIAAALCAASVASAQPHPAAGDAVVAPAKDKWLAESWAQILSLDISENPFEGNGNPCLTLANKVLQEVGGHCTIEQGTTFTFFLGSAWTNFEPPFPQTEAEQLAVAVAADQSIVSVTVTVDGGTTVDVRTPRFELFTKQRTVLLPPNPIFDLPGSQVATFTAHGWGAAIRKLGVGEHEITVDGAFADGGSFSAPHLVTVVPKHDT